MKNRIIILCFAICCLFTACNTLTSEDRKKLNSDQVQNVSTLVELTFNGETHEYVWYHQHTGQCGMASVAHWAGCKYCKEKDINNTNTFSIW